MKKRAYGFTIVELLIVIVVIAILAAISIVAYTGIQGRARDAQRMQDMSAIIKALEVYKTINGRYPSANPTSEANGWEISSNGSGPTNFLSALVSTTTGVTSIPVDPSNSTATGSAGANFRNPGRGTNNWVYFYAYYGAGSDGCDSQRGGFYVLGVARMDGIASGTTSSQSPGWSCPNRNWSTQGAWVTGKFTN